MSCLEQELRKSLPVGAGYLNYAFSKTNPQSYRFMQVKRMPTALYLYLKTALVLFYLR